LLLFNHKEQKIIIYIAPVSIGKCEIKKLFLSLERFWSWGRGSHSRRPGDEQCSPRDRC